MQPVLREIPAPPSPEALTIRLSPEEQPVLLRSGGHHPALARFSLLTAAPILTFSSQGARCEWWTPSSGTTAVQFGNPWHLLRERLAHYEVVDQPDAPFPTGGCFGYWGYDLKQFVEPKVGRTALNDLELPDCRLGFHPSLVVWDHQLGQAWVVATGLQLDGSRSQPVAHAQLDWWLERIDQAAVEPVARPVVGFPAPGSPASSITRARFLDSVRQALEYIRLGHIYQVNLAQRWSHPFAGDPWQLFATLSGISPAPFAGYQRWEDGAIISSSPEQFLRLSGRSITTRPIKGTRPRSTDPDEDARLSYELQTSEKERAELVMITDLLRNDLGRVCEFGSVRVPDLLRLERFSHVQHLVSTVTGELRADVQHVEALAASFPGGSITGAPKVRALQIIDELEPISRGPYTGSLGYIGFNRESQLNILIRTALVCRGQVHYHAGAGIVADSDPDAEYEETLLKARAFFETLTASARAPRRETNCNPGAT